MLCLSGFELYSRWMPLTYVRMLLLQLISLLIKFVYMWVHREMCQMLL